jgi:hypothetical protein
MSADKRIVYIEKDGGLAVLIPAPECLESYTIDQIAQKDVPEGFPYKIVDVSDLPADRTFRNAWEIDPTELTDGVGASHSTFDGVQNGN